MSLERVIFIKTHSSDSDKSEKLLKQENVNLKATFILNSYDEPILVVSNLRVSYEGYEEISEYVRTLP